MALLIADILSEANSRTGRAESSGDTFLKGILHDLSSRGLCLEAEETLALVTDDCDYAFSTFTNKFKRIKEVVILDSNSVPSMPLEEISWKRYKERLSENLSNGEPVEFCIYPTLLNEVLYLSPKPNATNYPYAKISGQLKHNDNTTIIFDEKYRELLIEGFCWKIETRYNVDGEKTKARFELYEIEIQKIFGSKNTISFGEYSDI